MKDIKNLLLLTIAAILAVLITYARFDYMQQEKARGRISALDAKVSNFLSDLNDVESRLRNYADKTQKLEGRLDSGEAEIRYIASKIEGMTQELREVQLNQAMDNKAAKKAVELGTVGVKKKK
jgi:chromosome segregation ATPase